MLQHKKQIFFYFIVFTSEGEEESVSLQTFLTYTSFIYRLLRRCKMNNVFFEACPSKTITSPPIPIGYPNILRA